MELVPSLNIISVLAIFLIQLPLMMLLPLLVGWFIRRRYGVGWGVFALGAATFVASQVVHIPLNMALGLIGTPLHGVALWPSAAMALVAGLSAGLCEEGARWIVLTFFAKRTRGWRAGLQFGAGHGGVEAIIFGTLVLVNAVTMIALSTGDPARIGITGASAEQLAAARSAYWSVPSYMFLIGGLERVFAITMQIGLASLVMAAVVRKQPVYLLAAIALHTAVDFWAVWAMPQFGAWAVEAGAALAALCSLWIIWRLREPEPAPDAEPVSATPAPLTAADLKQRTLTAEELSQRAEASRYS
jgi:uncharacterized membrane protein YhfC